MRFPERRDAAALGLFAALLVALLAPALFGPAPAGLGDPLGDGRTQFYPWRAFGFGEWRHADLPLWNPYALLGVPFVANLQSAMFYPPNWLCLVLPAHVASNWAIVLNLFLSATFTYALARRLALSRFAACGAGLTYTLAANHFFRVYQGHWSFLGAMPWVPAVMLCTDELLDQTRKRSAWGAWRAALLGGAALAMQLFAGMPQITFYTGLLVAIALLMGALLRPPEVSGPHTAETPKEGGKPRGLFSFILRPSSFILRSAAPLAAMAVLGVALAAVQMLPALELARDSSRAERVSLEWATQYSLPPENLLTLIVPDLLGGGEGNGAGYWGRWNFWETGAYVGVIGLALAVTSLAATPWRRWLPLAAPAAFFVSIALARYHPFYGPLFRAVPGFDLFRAPARAMAVAGLPLALLAAMGFDALYTAPCRIARRAMTAAAALMLVAAAVALCGGERPVAWQRFRAWCYARGERIPRYDDPSLRTIEGDGRTWRAARASLVRSSALIAAAATLAHLGSVWDRRRTLLAGAGVVLIALDLGGFARGFVATFDPRDRVWDGQTAAALQRDGQPFRLSLRTEWDRFPCDPMMDRIASLEGIEPNVPRRFHDFFWTTQGIALDTQRTEYRLARDHPLLDLVNLRYMVARAPRDGGGVAFRVGKREGAMPRAFLVHRVERVSDREMALHRLFSPDFDFRTAALLEGDDEAECVLPASPSPPPVFERYDPRGMTLRVRAHAPGLLVISDLHYPGWRARLDGRPVPVLRADYLLRAVAVPGGEHVVELEYAPASFSVGLAITLAAWLTLLGAFVAHALAARRKKDAHDAAPG